MQNVAKEVFTKKQHLSKVPKIWASFERKIFNVNFLKMPNLVTLELIKTDWLKIILLTYVHFKDN